MRTKKILVAIASVMVLAMGGVTPVMAAGDICSDPNFDDQQKEAAGCNANKVVGDVANDILQFVIGAMGLVAVGVVLYGGITYATSTGDAGKVMKAKRTIIYGLVGLAVCLLAFAIVRFVPKML